MKAPILTLMDATRKLEIFSSGLNFNVTVNQKSDHEGIICYRLIGSESFSDKLEAVSWCLNRLGY